HQRASRESDLAPCCYPHFFQRVTFFSRGIEHNPPRARGIVRYAKVDWLMMGIQQKNEIPIAQRLTVSVEIVEGVAGETDPQATGVRLIPFRIGHLEPVRPEPGNILDVRAPQRSPLKEVASPKRRMGST